MAESTSSENPWCKGKAEEQNDLYHTESAAQSVEANATSLADIFDTAFTSTVDPSPQSRYNSGIEMEYEHLFAESDIEESDVAHIDFANPSHHSSSDSETTGDSHEYRQMDQSNCNMCLNRQQRHARKEYHDRKLNTLYQKRARENYCRTRLLHDLDIPEKDESRRTHDHKLLSGQQLDGLSIAGPSRLSDAVSYNISRTMTKVDDVLNGVVQNLQNDSANESNTLYHPVLPNTLSTQPVHSAHTTRNDDAPSAPDLQLDWSSSNDSDDEDGYVEVLETVNHNNKVR